MLCPVIQNRLFYLCTDRMIAELENNFTNTGRKIMIGCMPPNYWKTSCAWNPCENQPHITTSSWSQKRSRWKKAFRAEMAQKPSRTMNVFKLFDPKIFWPLKSCLQVALTIPLSSCSFKSAFSAPTITYLAEAQSIETKWTWLSQMKGGWTMKTHLSKWNQDFYLHIPARWVEELQPRRRINEDEGHNMRGSHR